MDYQLCADDEFDAEKQRVCHILAESRRSAGPKQSVCQQDNQYGKNYMPPKAFVHMDSPNKKRLFIINNLYTLYTVNKLYKLCCLYTFELSRLMSAPLGDSAIGKYTF